MSSVFAWINIIVLFSVLAIVLKKKMGAHFSSERKKLEQEMAIAGEQYRKIKEELAVAQGLLSNIQNKIEDLKQTTLREIEFESKRIEEDSVKATQKIISDGEARMKGETEKMKRSLERELFDAALSSAREALRADFKKQDQEWVSQMIQEEGSRSGRKNYAS